MENIMFIFFAGSLFMAMLYHFVLYIIQRNSLLLHYTAYLFAATLFLTERVWLDDIFPMEGGLYKNKFFILFDEPIQMLIYFTYFRFATRALDIYSTPDKKFIAWYRLLLLAFIAYSAFHIAGISFNWFATRTVIGFVGIRILLFITVFVLFLRVSKYRDGLFFRFIIAGSLIMLIGGLLAFLTSLFNTSVLGLFGVEWSCLSLFLDVICFSAAIGYKSRKDSLEKQTALKQLMIKEKQLQQQELEKMNAVFIARDADRNQIARDLHDEIGSTLSSIHIYSSVAEKTLGSNPEKTKQVLEQININTRMVMDNMSDIVWAMKTGEQQDILLSNKIKNIGFEMLDAKNIKCSYYIQPEADKAELDINMRRNILLIVKESLNNIVKYSNASEVIMKINLTAQMLAVSITDNGMGFDMKNVHKGNGLQNMHFRAKQSGGVLTITSSLNGGTFIDCNFPVTNIRDEIKLSDDLIFPNDTGSNI